MTATTATPVFELFFWNGEESIVRTYSDLETAIAQAVAVSLDSLCEEPHVTAYTDVDNIDTFTYIDVVQGAVQGVRHAGNAILFTSGSQLGRVAQVAEFITRAYDTEASTPAPRVLGELIHLFVLPGVATVGLTDAEYECLTNRDAAGIQLGTDIVLFGGVARYTGSRIAQSADL